MATTPRGYPYPALTDAPNGPTQIQALAMAVDTDVSDVMAVPWTTYTPVLTGSTTNPTLGTGSSVLGEYAVIGNNLFCRGQISFGTSGASAGSGSYFISAPPGVSVIDPRAAFFRITGQVIIKAAGVWTQGFVHAEVGSTGFSMRYTTAAVNGSIVSVTNALPGVFTNSDSIGWNFNTRVS